MTKITFYCILLKVSGKAGTKNVDSLVAQHTPFAPNLITAVPTPFANNIDAALAADSKLFTSKPTNCAASISFVEPLPAINQRGFKLRIIVNFSLFNSYLVNCS